MPDVLRTRRASARTAAGFWTGCEKSLQGTSVAAAQLSCRLAREAAREPGVDRATLLERATGLPKADARRTVRPDTGRGVLADV